MRILALVTDGYGSYGGIGQYNRDLMSALEAADAVRSVTVLPRIGDASATPVYSKIRQQHATKQRLRYSWRAWRLARRLRPDVIFCGHLYMAPLAYAIARMFRIRFWLQLHGVEAWEMRSRVIRFAAERADFVTAVSRFTRARFLSWANLDPHKVKVLPNTFETAPLARESRDEIRARHGLTGRKVLLTVSRIDRADPYKGHDRVLRVLPRLIANDPSIVYLIVGDGDDRERLQAVAKDLSLSDHVRFAGRVSRDEVYDSYRVADAFVMPSAREGFGIVFLEAASFGVRVIGGNADGTVDALADGAIGDLVSVDDSNALEAAVQRVLVGAVPPSSTPARFCRPNFFAHVHDLLPILGTASGNSL